jgi:hypothetical protein
MLNENPLVCYDNERRAVPAIEFGAGDRANGNIPTGHYAPAPSAAISRTHAMAARWED